MSLRTLGRLAGVSSSSLNRWESGIGTPSDDLLSQISAILKQPISATEPDKVRLSTSHRGSLMRSLRFRGGYSQSGAAELFGCSRSAISRWEMGGRDAGDHVVQSYVEAFHATQEEADALYIGETVNPLPGASSEQLEALLAHLRVQRLSGASEPLDLTYLAADAALGKHNQRNRMRLYESYIERLEWEYRHREAYFWASRSLELAHESRDYDFVGRAVRATAHQLITEMDRPKEGLTFLANARSFAHGSASEPMIMRESADRLSQTGCLPQAWSALRQAAKESESLENHEEQLACMYLFASIAVSARRFDAALNVLAGASHADPYMQNHLVQLEAEARHALGDRKECMRVLEDGIQSLARPGLGHFSRGLSARMQMAGSHTYCPDLWRWRRSEPTRAPF